METRANYVAVGAFTLAAVLAAFIIIYWLGKFGSGKDLAPLDVQIQGSVSGLGKGSTVQFNGIDVGRVKALQFDKDNPQLVTVQTEISSTTPVRKDTRATIGIRGLSGGAFIALEGGDKDSPRLLAEERDENAPVPLIQGDPAAMADLITRVHTIAGRTERVMGALEKIVTSNQTTVNNTLANVETFSKALAANSDGVAKFMDSAGNVAIALNRITKQLDGSTTRVEEILQAVDPKKVSNTVSNIEGISKAIADQRQQLALVMTGAATAMASLNASSAELSSIMGKVDNVVSAIDPQEIKTTVSNLEKTSQQAEKVFAAVDTEKLGNAMSDLADTAKNVRAVVAGIKPEAVSGLMDDVSQAGKKVSLLVEKIEPDGINAAVKSFEKAAAQAETILAAVDSTKVGQAVDSFSAAGASAQNLLAGIKPAAINTLVTDLSDASKDAAQLMKALDPNGINEAVQNISKAAAGAQGVVSDVRGVTAGLGEHKEDINQMISNATQLVARLNETSVKIDSVVSRADSFLGGGSSNGLATEAEKTLIEIRRAARSLSQSVSRVASDVDGFTKRGLGDVQGLVSDARRSVDSINRVMRNIQDNPSSLISGSGGSRIRETSTGRPRR